MAGYLGDFTTTHTVYVFFNSISSNDPAASVTLTGLVVGDINIYKNGSVTQRTSTAGFTLLDTDGIDFDAITGLNGFSINLADNTDAGFYAAGNEYMITVNSVTIDAGVINFIAGSFSIERATKTQADVALILTDTAVIGAAGAGLTALPISPANVTQLGGVVQSLTDLKDFADEGYNPATNKVTGVVLVDTTTVNTDMVAAAPTAAANADAVWDEDATPHQTLGTFGQAIGDPVIDSTTLYAGVVSGAAGAHIAADIIVIESQTDDIGVAGVGLSNIPWNAAWDAEVESEVNDALDTVIAELGVAAPAITPTIRTAIMLLYMALRNKLDVQTSATDALEIHNDAGTQITSKLLTDAAGDYSEAKMT